MSTDSSRRSGALPILAGVVLLHVVCCGLILTLGVAGALGALGAVLGNPWVVAAAVILVGALVTVALRRRAGANRPAGADCRDPQGSGPSRESATQVGEARS